MTRPRSIVARVALEGDAHSVVERGRDPVGAAEVLAGARRQDGDLRARAGDPVHDLVQRPVAADDDEQVVRRRGLARELDQVPAALGEDDVAGEPELGGALLRASASACPSRRSRSPD